MPRKRGHANRGKKSGRGSGTAQASSSGSSRGGTGSHDHYRDHVQNVHGSVHQHSRVENLEKDKENAFQSLEEMFRETLDADVIHMVLVECDWKVDAALESLITLAGAGGESSRSMQMADERSTLSGIASSLFTYPSRADDMQNDLSGTNVRSHVGPRDEDFDVTDEEDHYDDFDLGTRDEMMLDQISDSIGISDDHRVVPPIRDFENSLEQIDDTPLLHSSLPAGSEHQVTPNLPWNSKANLPDLTCLYPGNIDSIETRASSVSDSSNKPNESSKGFAKSIQLAETYEKLAQSSNYYLYDFEEISSTCSYLHETESNPVDFELKSNGSPDLELYDSGPISEVQGALFADLEKKLGNTIPKPLEFISDDGACSGGVSDSHLTRDFIVSSINVTSSEQLNSMSSPQTVRSDSFLMNEPMLPSVGVGEDLADSSFNLESSKTTKPFLSVETIGPARETDSYGNNSPLSVLEPALDAESQNNQTDDAFREIYGPLGGPDVVTASVIQDEEASLGIGQKLRKNSESVAVDVGDDFEDILAAAADAAEAANGNDEDGDPSDDSEMGKKFVHVYNYSSTSSSKEDSPEPLGGATGKKICRKKKKRSGGGIKAVYSGREEDFGRDADGLVNRMVGARDFLKNMNSEQSTVKANSEVNLQTNPERTVEVETLCQRMLGFRNVLKTQAAEKNDSDVLETFDIDEMSDVRTLSHSDSESSDSSHRITWPDILDLPSSSSKPIATISADIADRIPELEIIEYNLETIQESAEFSDGADDFGHEKGSIRRFITLDKIELPPKVQRQADLVAKGDDIQVNVEKVLESEPGTSCDDNGGTACAEDVVMAHEVCRSSVHDAVNLEENADETELLMACISTDSVNVESIVRRLEETGIDVQSGGELLSTGSQCREEKDRMGEKAVTNLTDGITDDAAGVLGVEDTLKLLLGIGPDETQESAKSCDDIKSQTSPSYSGNTSQENSEEFSRADALKPLKQPVLSDPDPEAMIKVMLGVEAASHSQSLSCASSDVSDKSSNKERDVTPVTGDIGADCAIKKLLGIGAADEENRSRVIGINLERSEDKLSTRESGAYEDVVLLKEGDVIESESKLSVSAEEFVPTGPREHLPGVSAPGIFLLPNVNSSSSSDLPLTMPAFVTPKMNAGSTGLPPVPYQFDPVADMTGFQQPFVPQPAFQSGVFYHSGENVVAQPIGQGRGRGKEKRGGRKSPFSKLAANFNQFSYTEQPTFMSVPPGFNHGARKPMTETDLGRNKQQFDDSGKANARISHNKQTGIPSTKQPNIHAEDESTNNTFTNSSSGKTSISEDRVLPEKCSGSEQGQRIPSFAAMAAKSAEGTSNRPAQRKNTRSSKSQELPANDDQVQMVRRHLDRGDKVLIMMRGCPGSGKSTLARQLLFNGVILSTDDFFVSDDGRYLYEQEKIGDAHEWNQERALKNMKSGVSPIIIDNTNIQAWEMKPYVIRGIEHGYKVEIFEPNTPWQFRPGELARRNSHNVLKEHITRMIDRYNHNVTVEQIVGSSDKLRARAVQKQQADIQRTKEAKTKRKRSGKKQPVQTATTKLQPKVTNRFALLGDESEALTTSEDRFIVEAASVAMQALPVESERISADVKVDVRADDTEEVSSGSPSGEISPDVVVESDGANSTDGKEVAAALNDAVMKNKEQLLDDFCAVVDNFDLRDCLSGGVLPNETSDSDSEVDARISDDTQSSKVDGKQLNEADVVRSRDETALNEKVTDVDSCVPPTRSNNGSKDGEDVSSSSLDSDQVKLTPFSAGLEREFLNDDFSAPEPLMNSSPSTSQGAEQTNLRKNVKTENVLVGSEPLPSGKRSPRTGWAGWGSSAPKGSVPTVSKSLKPSSGNEWTSSGESQPYFWSAAQGLVRDNRHVDVPEAKSEDIVDLPHEQKPGVEVVTSAVENVWEEPKTRRERRQRNQGQDSATSPSKVINTEHHETGSDVGDNISETLASCLISEERHKDSDGPILLNMTDGSELDNGNAESVEVSAVSDQTCEAVPDSVVPLGKELPRVVSPSESSRCNADSKDVSLQTPTNRGQGHKLPLAATNESSGKETENTEALLQVGNNLDEVSETSNPLDLSETSVRTETHNFKTDMLDSVPNVPVSVGNSKEDSEISYSVRQEGKSSHAVTDISKCGQGNEMVSNSEVETFQRVKKSGGVEAVCNADSSLKVDQSTKSETLKEERTVSISNEAEVDIEDGTPAELYGEIEESESSLKATRVLEAENVIPADKSISPDVAQEIEEVDAVVEGSAICFDSDADTSVAGHSDETHLPVVSPKEDSLMREHVESSMSQHIEPSTLVADGGTPTLLSLRDLCNNAVEAVSQQESPSAKKLPGATPSRKTKSQKPKLTPKQKFVKGIKEDIVAIGKSLPQDWTLPDFLVTPSSVKFEKNSIQANTGEEPERKEYTDSGTHTSSHDFVLLYKVQKNLPYNLSDVKVIDYDANRDPSGWTAERTSLSTSAPGSPKKRTPFLLDKSCNTDEESIPLSVEADLKFLKSCFPTVSEGDLKDILDHCGKDVEWAVNLLLDSGYEYNLPKTTKERAKSEGRDDDKDVDTAQENMSEVHSPERTVVKRGGEFLETKADGRYLASPDTQSCHQPGGLASLSQNVLTDSNWLNSWGSLGGYNLPMPGDYHFDVSDLPFEQTTFPPQQKSQNEPQDGLSTATTPHASNIFSELDAIDNVEIKTRPQGDFRTDHFGLIPSTESTNSSTFELKTSTAHETANAQPPLQSSTPTLEANKYQKIIDTVTGASTAPIIEPMMYMPIPGIRKLKNSYDYVDQRKESSSDRSSTMVDVSKSSDTSPDDMDQDMKEEWSSEDCGLSMELSPSMALGLQELFGPVGFHVNAESLCPDDLKISLSYNIARLLHEAWAKTLEEKMVKEEDSITQMLKSDLELAQQLQSEEEAMHHVTKIITMPRRKGSASSHFSPQRSHSPKAGQSPNTHRKYTDAPSSGITFKEEFPNRLPRSLSPSTSLQQIMEEELAMKKKREEEMEKLTTSASHDTMARRMKRQKLYELFPGLQESILDEIFESCGHALGPTVSAIRGPTEENPQSVFTSSNLSDYEEILVREAEVESKNPKYLGKSSADYQTFEDPDYQDYRAEATLHYNIRCECFQKAQEAHRRGKKQVATFYSQQGHMHTEKIRAANKRASEKMLEHRSGKLQKSNTLDLHGLHVSEAIEALEDILTRRQNENAERPDKRKLHLYVVTGRGAHSKGGIARIKPAIVGYLNRNGYRFSEPQIGMLRINVNQFAQ
ncbi:uncharacterized protein LOC135493227 [Lineus longissimus]|uniref:uncharacterized protein LOC135493227 n=1 Tax=Lineus longissimus TaxID=88925 RepID=UPI002B4EB3C9